MQSVYLFSMRNGSLSAPHKQFEDIKKIDKNGIEYWEARELMMLLEYTEWRKFSGIIEKAKKSCSKSGQKTKYHFVGIDKMIKLATGTAKETIRKIQDYK